MFNPHQNRERMSIQNEVHGLDSGYTFGSQHFIMAAIELLFEVLLDIRDILKDINQYQRGGRM